MSELDLIAYMKALVSEVHALRREQMQMSVRIDDMRARLERYNQRATLPPPPALPIECDSPKHRTEPIARSPKSTKVIKKAGSE